MFHYREILQLVGKQVEPDKCLETSPFRIIVDTFRGLLAARLLFDIRYDDLGSCRHSLSQKLAVGTDCVHTRVNTIQIQREDVWVLTLETDRAMRFRVTGSQKKAGASGQKVVIYREEPLSALYSAYDHVEGRGEVIPAEGQWLLQTKVVLKYVPCALGRRLNWWHDVRSPPMHAKLLIVGYCREGGHFRIGAVLQK